MARAGLWATLLSPWLANVVVLGEEVSSVQQQQCQDFLQHQSRDWNNLVVHEERTREPVAWDKVARANKDVVLPLRIGLKQQNLENAEQYVYDVADPDSPNYGMSTSSP